MASAEVRLLDPSAFRLRNASSRRRALSISAQPKISREARLAAAMQRAEAGAFAVPNETLLARIRETLKARGGALRLSELPAGSATEVLGNMQLVEALRSSRAHDIGVTRLDARLDNGYYSGADYLIESKA
jgi:hypothetical protein